MLAEIKKELAALETLAIIETDYASKGYHLDVEVGPAQVVACAELLDGLGLFLESITGVDWLGKTPVGNAVKTGPEPETAAGAPEDGGETGSPGPEVAEVGDKFEVVYDYNYTGGGLCRIVVRCRIDRVTPDIPTISSIIPGANWHERETHDFFGINFLGHPDLSPLLLPEDADFHPLRKDFKV